MSKLGNNDIGSVCLGNHLIDKAYLGTNLVFLRDSEVSSQVYTEVEYIQTDGVAYIDTGISGSAPVSSEVKCVPVSSSSNYYILGSRGSGDTRLFLISITPAKYVGYSYYNGIYASTLSIASSIAAGTPMIVRTRLRKGSQIVEVKQAGDTQFSSASTPLNYQVSNGFNMYLLAINSSGTPVVAQSGTKVSYVKIYSDFDFGTLIFDGVPCYYRGEYGIWDRVSNSFFGNSASSGAFTGPAV